MKVYSKQLDKSTWEILRNGYRIGIIKKDGIYYNITNIKKLNPPVKETWIEAFNYIKCIK